MEPDRADFRQSICNINFLCHSSFYICKKEKRSYYRYICLHFGSAKLFCRKKLQNSISLFFSIQKRTQMSPPLNKQIELMTADFWTCARGRPGSVKKGAEFQIWRQTAFRVICTVVLLIQLHKKSTEFNLGLKELTVIKWQNKHTWYYNVKRVLGLFVVNFEEL